MEQWVLEISGQFETFGSEAELLNRVREKILSQLSDVGLDHANIRSGSQRYDIEIDIRLIEQG